MGASRYAGVGSSALAADYVALGDRPAPTVKAADETVNNSASAQDDDELLVAVGANETWIVEWTLFIDGDDTTADAKLGVSAPAGASGGWGAIGLGSAAASSEGVVRDLAWMQFTGGVTVAVGSTTAAQMHLVRAVVTTGASAGNVVLQWAQNTATASNLIVKAGSYMRAERVA